MASGPPLVGVIFSTSPASSYQSPWYPCTVKLNPIPDPWWRLSLFMMSVTRTGTRRPGGRDTPGTHLDIFPSTPTPGRLQGCIPVREGSVTSLPPTGTERHRSLHVTPATPASVRVLSQESTSDLHPTITLDLLNNYILWIKNIFKILSKTVSNKFTSNHIV